MKFFAALLRIFDAKMQTPTLYGWFHLLWLAIVAFATVGLCYIHKKKQTLQESNVLLWVSVCVILLELYKQMNYSFSYEGGVKFDFQWYAFPFQFCSTPMYVGLLAGLTRKGRVHDALCAYLATFSVFAGAAVMFYPGDVFVKTIGINIQTMICHGSMISLGVYLLYTGHVKTEHRTILRAGSVFAICVVLAAVMNDVAFATGLLEKETFNMFYISPYCDPHLPVYSMVQRVVPYPLSLVIYIAGFTAASYVILLAAMGIRKLSQSHKTKTLIHA